MENQAITRQYLHDLLDAFLNSGSAIDKVVFTREALRSKMLDAFGEDILDLSRRQEVVNARNFAIKALMSGLKMTLTDIGKMLGKDHSTIINSIEKVDDKMLNSVHYQGMYRAVLAAVMDIDNGFQKWDPDKLYNRIISITAGSYDDPGKSMLVSYGVLLSINPFFTNADRVSKVFGITPRACRKMIDDFSFVKSQQWLRTEIELVKKQLKLKMAA